MTRRRLSSRGAVATISLIATMAIAGLFTAAPVGATTRAPMTVKRDQPAETDFPPMLGSPPVGQETIQPSPPDCALATYCDTVPLDVVVPANLGKDDELVLLLEISWDDQVGVNDLDTYLYDDQQTKGGAGYTRVGSGASSDNPEKPKAYRPTLGRYNLVVVNFTGANLGYHVKAALKVDKFAAPFETLSTTSTAPAAAGGGSTARPTGGAATSTSAPQVLGSSETAVEFGSTTVPAAEAAGGSASPAAAAARARRADNRGWALLLSILAVFALLGLITATGLLIARRRTVSLA